MIKYLTASHRIARIFGIEIRVMYILYLFMGVMILTYATPGYLPGLLSLIIAVVLFPLYTLLHELGHSLAAMKERVRVRGILLHPLGGVAMLEGLIPGPLAEIFIALAGPFVSLLLAALAVLPLLLTGSAQAVGNLNILYSDSFFTAFLASAFVINIGMALFNLLPIFPMDGGRVATAIAVIWLGPDKGTRVMSKVALAGVGTMIVIGGIIAWGGNFRLGVGLMLIGTFLYTTGKQELQARTFAARYTHSSSFGFQAEREPWSLPEWNPETGFVEVPTKLKPNWFKRRRLQKQRERKEREQQEELLLRQRVDDILAKVNEVGFVNLTPEEKDILNQASQRYREKTGSQDS